MLSIVLYGRNDSHGYNLHKRAALSLNCIAEVLTDADDEIIFVDYNTPDELPTFPEAIADTLTEACKRRLRVLRVRPGFHQRYTGQTRLVALESQSRNIAIRRANPANRWILSTNTDMIFCPQGAHGSLNDAIGALDDGFYHLPRFEVPEGFWERLDRQAPKDAIAAMEANAVRFHLNEIVYGAYDNLYEAPGDFQLFLRSDLDAIDGFDERMILGWHVDSNIARRMRLLRGEVRTALPHLWGYHCGHTRQATALHGGTRTENDFKLFVENLFEAGIPSQAATWGAPDEPIEEIRLLDRDPYFAALSDAIPASSETLYEATYNDSSFGKVAYDRDHVLPHLCDLLYNLPPGQKVLYFGADIELLRGLRQFFDAAGRSQTIMVAATPLLQDASAWAALGAVTDTDEGVRDADVVLIQYPSQDMAPEDARRAQEWLCQRFLFSLPDAGFRNTAGRERRVLVVNGIHNGLTQPMDFLLAPTVMPFSARTRQGFLKDTPDAARGGGAEQPIYERLRRRLPFSPYDRGVLDRTLRGLAAGAPPAGWERLSPEIAAIASSPADARSGFPVTDETAPALIEAAAEAMRLAVAQLAEPPRVVAPRPHVGNRLCSGSDWDSAEWLRMAAAFFNLDALDYRGRTRWMWERVSLAVAAQRFAPPRPLSGAQAPTVFFLSETPDPLAAVLAHMGFEVRFTTAVDLASGAAPGDWSHVLERTSLTFPDTWKPYRPAEPIRFDLFVSPLPCLFERPAAEVDEIFGKLHAAMKPGALFLATAPVQINAVAYGGALSLGEWMGLYSPEGPLGHRGFVPVGDVDPTIPLDSALRFAFQDDPQETIRGLCYGFYESRITSALLTARWPETLGPAPDDRLVWPRRDERLWRVSIPYLAAGEAVLAVPRPQATQEGGRLEARAERALADRPIAAPQAPAVTPNVVAHVSTDCVGERTPLNFRVLAEDSDSDLGPWISLGLECPGARRIIVDITCDAEIAEVASVVWGWGAGTVEFDGGRIVVLPRGETLDRAGIAIRFAGDAVNLTAVKVSAEL